MQNPPAYVQMADPDVAPWCLLEDTSSLFRVSVPSGTNVDGLKTAIKAKIPNTLKNIDAPELTIFKVCTFRLAYSTQLMHSWKLNTNIPLGPNNTLLGRLPAVEFCEELEPHEMLSVLEPLTPNHLHIIVRRPPEGECKCLVITVILTMWRTQMLPFGVFSKTLPHSSGSLCPWERTYMV